MAKKTQYWIEAGDIKTNLPVQHNTGAWRSLDEIVWDILKCCGLGDCCNANSGRLVERDGDDGELTPYVDPSFCTIVAKRELGNPKREMLLYVNPTRRSSQGWSQTDGEIPGLIENSFLAGDFTYSVTISGVSSPVLTGTFATFAALVDAINTAIGVLGYAYSLQAVGQDTIVIVDSKYKNLPNTIKLSIYDDTHSLMIINNRKPTTGIGVSISGFSCFLGHQPIASFPSFNVTDTCTLTFDHAAVVCKNGATNITLTLPDPANVNEHVFMISRGEGSTGDVTIDPAGSALVQNLDGTLTTTTTLEALGDYGQHVILQSNGTSWYRKN